MSNVSSGQGEDPESWMQLMTLAVSGSFPRALVVAAKLDIPDILNDASMSSDDLADRTGADPDILRHVLQLLALCGAFHRDQDGRYKLAPGFDRLRSDHPQSVRNTFLLMADTYADAFGPLLETTRTGRSGFEQVHGVPLYEYLPDHPEAEKVFDGAMAELARPAAAALVEWFDFSSVRRVVDVGGGNGAMLAAILAANPHLDGVCVDRPTVCERAAARHAESGDPALVDRLRFEPADIFESVVEGGDLYLLKNVLNDWDPDSRLRILATVRDAMARTAESRDADAPRQRLVVLQPLPEQAVDAVSSLYQIAVFGKGARRFESRDDWRSLFAEAKLDLVSIERLSNGHHAFECVL